MKTAPARCWLALPLALASLFGLSGCVVGERWLVGTWKSNRERTVATLRFRAPIAAKDRQKLEEVFGQMVLSYDGKFLLAELPPKDGNPAWRYRTEYRVVATEGNSLTYVAKDLIADAPKVTEVHFEGPNRFWMPLRRSDRQGSREYFDRISDGPRRRGPGR